MTSALGQWGIEMNPCSLEWWEMMAKKGMYSINVVSFLAPNLDQAKSNEFTKAICRVMAPWLISRSHRSTTIIFIGERSKRLRSIIINLLKPTHSKDWPTICTCAQPIAGLHWRASPALTMAIRDSACADVCWVQL